MKNSNLLLKALTIITFVLLLCSPITSCGKPTEEPPVKTPPENTIDISGYSVIYGADADESVIKRAEKLASSVEKTLGLSLSISQDTNSDENKKEILIGATARTASIAAAEKLAKEESKDAFTVEITENDIVILGKTDLSTTRAVEFFISNYVTASVEEPYLDISAGKSVTKPFDIVNTITLENGTEIDVEIVSDIFAVPGDSYTEDYGYPAYVNTAHYPSIIELQHNGENNGKLLAIFCLNDIPLSADAPYTNGCVMESSDGGATWKMISRPEETIDPSIKGISMAHIYELPAQVGDMPAGTILYSGNSVNYNRKSHIGVWRSFDCGYTWEEYVIIAEGGGTREGVWEPFMWYEENDGYLYCFYSDDSDPKHDQKLVYKRSKDGVSWSEVYDVCTFEKTSDRPGMFIMTSMGEGRYFMVYEYFGSHSGDVFYKTTHDITSWDPDSPGKKLVSTGGYGVIGGPSCIWTPIGNDQGILIASGKKDADGEEKHYLLVSLNSGSTWSTIENPLYYDMTKDALNTNRIGHSPSFVLSSDPSVIYYVNTTVNPETGRQRIQFARMKVYE